MYAIQQPTELPFVGVIDTGVRAGIRIQTWSPASLPPGVRIRPAEPERLAAANAVLKAAHDDERATDRALDQHYTAPVIARCCVAAAAGVFDLHGYQIIEPSAGNGAFLRVLPSDTVGVDVDPKYRGIIKADFLSITIECDRPILVVGNPPFGWCSDLAVGFFNHAASFTQGIALVVPRTFRKASILRRLNRNFHLEREVELPHNAFLFRGKPFNVPAVFQVWVRRATVRDLPSTETEHADFAFVERDESPYFMIQRVGSNAGQVHRDFHLKDSSHYFIRPNVEGVEAILTALEPEFRAVAANTAGNPSLAKTEIVALYREQTERVTAYWRAQPNGPA